MGQRLGHLRVGQRVLRRFGHLKRMNEYYLARRVSCAEVSGARVWGRPRFGWMDQSILTNNRYMQREFELKFSALLIAYNIKYADNSKK